MSLTVDAINSFETDITSLKNQVTDALITGNAIYASSSHNTGISNDVSARNDELQKRKKELQRDIEKKEALINRSNRDFTDVKGTLPETLPKKTLNVMEDYTLAVLVISYLFMVSALLYFYAMMSPEPFVTTLMRGIGYALVVTLFVWMGLYYIC